MALPAGQPAQKTDHRQNPERCLHCSFDHVAAEEKFQNALQGGWLTGIVHLQPHYVRRRAIKHGRPFGAVMLNPTEQHCTVLTYPSRV